MGLQLADVANDPLVKETIQVFQDAIAEARKGRDYYGPSPDDFETQLDNPAARLLAETDSLDSATAAALAADHLTGWVSIEDVEKKLNPDVADVIKLLRGDGEVGPEELLKSASPLGLKLLVATVTAATTGDEFRQMLADAHPTEIRAAMAEISGFVVDIAEHITEHKSWEVLPPRLLDRYIEGIGNLAALAPGKMQKRLMTMVAGDLKTEIAKAAAAELAAKAPPAPPDPESPFEKLKNDARKFKL